MSSESGGSGVATGGPSVKPATLSYADAANAAKRREVSRDKDFVLVCDKVVPVDVVVDAVIASVNPPQDLNSVQQITDRRFIISFKSSAAAAAYNLHGASGLSIPGTNFVCKWLGADIRKIKVTYLPTAIENKKLEEVLTSYGRVLSITDEVYTGKAVLVKTGTRIVELEMTRPVPNLITVCGYTVPAVYRGVVVQCRRCLQEGHLKATCNTPFCERCKTFGHEETTCAAPCFKCGSIEHHWRDCKIRNYVLAAGGPRESNQETALIELHDEDSSLAQVPQKGSGNTIATIATGKNMSPEHQVGGTAKIPDDSGGARPEGAAKGSESAAIGFSQLLQFDCLPAAAGSSAETAEPAVATACMKPVEAVSKNEVNNGAILARGHTGIGNHGWHLIQTRSSKRRQTSLTPGISPGAKRAPSNP